MGRRRGRGGAAHPDTWLLYQGTLAHFKAISVRTESRGVHTIETTAVVTEQDLGKDHVTTQQLVISPGTPMADALAMVFDSVVDVDAINKVPAQTWEAIGGVAKHLGAALDQHTAMDVETFRRFHEQLGIVDETLQVTTETIKPTQEEEVPKRKVKWSRRRTG